MYQYIFFYFCLLLMPSVLSAEELYSESWKQAVFDSFRHSFSGTSFSSLFFLAAFVIALVLGVVWWEIRRSSMRRRASDELNWERFREKAARVGFSSAELDFLTEVIRVSGTANVDAVLSSATVFEKTLEQFYEERGIDNIGEAEFALVRVLRQRLGFDRLSTEVPFVSSRQFRLHGGIYAQLLAPASDRDQGDEVVVHSWQTAIVAVTEKYWSVSRPEGPAIASGSVVILSLTRPDDGKYRVRTTVLTDAEHELRLLHTRDLTRHQWRNWVRIDVDIPVRAMRVMPGENADRVEELMTGRIRDLSGGGLSLSLGHRLDVGALLDLEFELPGHGLFRKVRVKVVRMQSHFRGDPSKFLHSASFEGDFKTVQEKIIQFVFEKQRQEARMREGL